MKFIQYKKIKRFVWHKLLLFFFITIVIASAALFVLNKNQRLSVNQKRLFANLSLNANQRDSFLDILKNIGNAQVLYFESQDQQKGNDALWDLIHQHFFQDRMNLSQKVKFQNEITLLTFIYQSKDLKNRSWTASANYPDYRFTDASINWKQAFNANFNLKRIQNLQWLKNVMETLKSAFSFGQKITPKELQPLYDVAVNRSSMYKLLFKQFFDILFKFLPKTASSLANSKKILQYGMFISPVVLYDFLSIFNSKDYIKDIKKPLTKFQNFLLLAKKLELNKEVDFQKFLKDNYGSRKAKLWDLVSNESIIDQLIEKLQLSASQNSKRFQRFISRINTNIAKLRKQIFKSNVNVFTREIFYQLFFYPKDSTSRVVGISKFKNPKKINAFILSSLEKFFHNPNKLKKISDLFLRVLFFNYLINEKTKIPNDFNGMIFAFIEYFVNFNVASSSYGFISEFLAKSLLKMFKEYPNLKNFSSDQKKNLLLNTIKIAIREKFFNNSEVLYKGITAKTLIDCLEDFQSCTNNDIKNIFEPADKDAKLSQILKAVLRKNNYYSIIETFLSLKGSSSDQDDSQQDLVWFANLFLNKFLLDVNNIIKHNVKIAENTKLERFLNFFLPKVSFADLENILAPQKAQLVFQKWKLFWDNLKQFSKSQKNDKKTIKIQVQGHGSIDLPILRAVKASDVKNYEKTNPKAKVFKKATFVSLVGAVVWFIEWIKKTAANTEVEVNKNLYQGVILLEQAIDFLFTFFRNFVLELSIFKNWNFSFFFTYHILLLGGLINYSDESKEMIMVFRDFMKKDMIKPFFLDFFTIIKKMLKSVKSVIHLLGAHPMQLIKNLTEKESKQIFVFVLKILGLFETKDNKDNKIQIVADSLLEHFLMLINPSGFISHNETTRKVAELVKSKLNKDQSIIDQILLVIDNQLEKFFYSYLYTKNWQYANVVYKDFEAFTSGSKKSFQISYDAYLKDQTIPFQFSFVWQVDNIGNGNYKTTLTDLKKVKVTQRN